MAGGIHFAPRTLPVATNTTADSDPAGWRIVVNAHGPRCGHTAAAEARARARRDRDIAMALATRLTELRRERDRLEAELAQLRPARLVDESGAA